MRKATKATTSEADKTPSATETVKSVKEGRLQMKVTRVRTGVRAGTLPPDPCRPAFSDRRLKTRVRSA